MTIKKIFKSGIIYGNQINELFEYAKQYNFAIPAVNCIGNESINAAIEAAQYVNSPIIIQFSNGGSKFIAGKNLLNNSNSINASVMGSVLAAKYIHSIAQYCKIPIIIHTDHCNKELLKWIDDLLEIEKEYYNANKIPLFCSHMLDLSTETLENNLNTTLKYMEIMDKIKISIEMELGCTGGEEDGIYGPEINNQSLYTQPQDIYHAYKEMIKINKNFTIAASFGNVHGVYKPGNVKLLPKILSNAQKYVKENMNLDIAKPVNFVFHGGSGTEKEKIEESINYGIVKINIDTDTQWATWNGVLNYYKKYKYYLHGQIGNPDGEDMPNKKYYDPRKWLQYGQNYMRDRLIKAFEEFNCINRAK